MSATMALSSLSAMNFILNLFRQDPYAGAFACAVLIATLAVVSPLFISAFWPEKKVIGYRLFWSTFLAMLVIASFLGFSKARELFANAPEAAASLGWPNTQGTVRRSWVDPTYLSRGAPRYLLQADYDYVVNGISYHSHRIQVRDAYGVGMGFRYEDDAKSHAYPVGAKVTVYYNPDHPEAAVLSPGGSRKIYGQMLFWLFLAGAGLCCLFMLGRTAYSGLATRPVQNETTEE